jgi:branched-chain amino acid transport system ATP-binding protein
VPINRRALRHSAAISTFRASHRTRQAFATLDLSGEAQILALANALIPEPRILLMDEPSLGLAPPLVSKTLNHVQKICRERGTAALIVEQKVREVLKIAERACVLRTGQVSYFGLASALGDEEKLRKVYL